MLRIVLCSVAFTFYVNDMAAYAFTSGSVELQPAVLIANAADRRGVRVNRNSQVTALYNAVSNGPDQLFFGGPGVSATYSSTTGSRYVNFAFTNWGVAILDFGGPGSGIATAAIGQPPSEIFRSPVSVSLPAINDAGQIAFIARDDNSHGNRESYMWEPGQSVVELPDLGEHELSEPPLIDASGRLVVRQIFGSTIPRTLDIYRHTPGSGWDNLTEGLLPPGAQIDTSAGIPIREVISPEGDFIFGVRRQPVGEPLRFEVFLWDDSEGTVSPIFDYTSQFTSFNGTPFSLNMEGSFSDNNDLWLVAMRDQSFSQREFKYLYRRGDGTEIDIDALLPDGESVYPDSYAHAMNFDGDLWLATRVEATQLINYYLLEKNRLTPVIQNSNQLLFQPALTNSHELYFWGQSVGGSYNLMRLTIPNSVPEPHALSLLVVMAAMLFKGKIESGIQEQLTRMLGGPKPGS